MLNVPRIVVLAALLVVGVLTSTVVSQTKTGKFKADQEKFDAERTGKAAPTAKKSGKKGSGSKKSDGSKKSRKAAHAEFGPLDKALTEHALSAEQLDAIVGEEVNLLLNDGKRIESVKVLKFTTGKDRASFKSVSVEGEATNGKAKPRSFVGKSLFRIEVDKRPYDLRFIASQKGYVLIDVEKHTETIKTQLEAQQYKLWEPLSQEKMERYIEEDKKFLLDVKAHFSGLPMHEKESKYFLFLTDMPPNQIGPYLANLDSMNERLGEAFGFEPGQNVWRGKCVIVAFVEKESFLEFETTIMKVPAPENAQGICHTEGNGRVIVAINRGDNPEFFGAVLVHETSHGYMHRYKSNRPITRWLNEGIADWIAGVTVPESNEVRVRQQAAAERLQSTQSLEGLFNGGQPEAWQYGVGSSIVDMLVAQDKEKFRLFFDGIKEGLTWEDSLQRAYGATTEDLIREYGQAIGVQNLQP